MTENPKFGVYDHAQKAWLSTHDTPEEAEHALWAADVKTAVVAPYDGTAPAATPDGEPNAPSESPSPGEKPESNPNEYELNPPRPE
jgi:hypothetical protein